MCVDAEVSTVGNHLFRLHIDLDNHHDLGPDLFLGLWAATMLKIKNKIYMKVYARKAEKKHKTKRLKEGIN